MLLVLRAFASGSTAMTGIEAISNAVPAFKPTEWRNARTTLTWMVSLLIVLFAGTIAMVKLDGIVPSAHETVLSQLAHRSFGSGFMYPVTQAATAAMLLLAANTAYNDFPRVLFLLAREFHAPRLFLRMGDRLAFSNGIIVLSVAAASIYVRFGGKTDPLIPLYAVGVFLAFTLSQSGMVVHWWRLRDPHWRRSLSSTPPVRCSRQSCSSPPASRSSPRAPGYRGGDRPGRRAAALAIRRHYTAWPAAAALHPHTVEVPSQTIVLACRSEGRSGDAGEDGMRGGARAAPRGAEETPEEIHHLVIVPMAVIDLRACVRSRTPPRCASPCWRCTSVPSRRRPSASAVLAHVGDTCRSRSSSRPIARSWRRWSTTSSRCIASARS